MTELKLQHVEEALDAAEASVSLNQGVGEAATASSATCFADRTAEDPWSSSRSAIERQRVRDALELLPERERQVMELRFGLSRGHDGISLEQIGQRLGLTRERIRQLEASGLSRLKQLLESTPLHGRYELAGAA